MLFVKNMVFVGGAIPAWPPTSTCSPRSCSSRCTSPPGTATASGRRGHYGIELGLSGEGQQASTNDRALTHRDIQQRRETIRRSLASQRGRPVAADGGGGGGRRYRRRHALVVARCTVDYAGRLSAHLPLARGW
jgi:hypothetical protein